ncbi:MAG: HDOD domain-containing protein [Acidobacteriota bacterium]
MSSLTIKPMAVAPFSEAWGLHSLPPFPAAAARLLQLLAKEEFEPSELMAVVKSDPMFAAELLRTVNSARFARAQEIYGLQHAAALLGRGTMRSFAIAVSLRLYLGGVLQRGALARVWRHSLATAVICELLTPAEDRRKQNVMKDAAYLAGLLHDVGCLGLMALHPQAYTEVLTLAAEQAVELRSLEIERFGVDHCEAGRWIAHKWKFSPELQDVTLYHHDPFRGGDPLTVLEVVKVAASLADSLGWAVVPSMVRTPAEAMASLPPQLHGIIKIHPDEVHQLVADGIAMFEQSGNAQNARDTRKRDR